jgi:hypothetical protein
MRKTFVVGAGLLVMAAALTVAAQESKPKSGHETMTKGSGGSADAAKIAKAMSAAPPAIAKGAT